MVENANPSPDSPLADLRHRGQFLIAVLFWAAAGGLIIVTCSSAVVAYHYAISLAERVRAGLGFAPPPHGPDWFLLIALSSGPLIALLAVVFLAHWYQSCGCDVLHWFGQIRGSGAGFQSGSLCPFAAAIQNANKDQAISYRC